MEGVEITGTGGDITDNDTTEFIADQTEDGTVYSFDSIILTGLSHTWAADLVITITAPDGTSSILVENDGGNHDFYGEYVFVSPDEKDFPSLYDYNGIEVYDGDYIIPQTLRARGRIEELTPSGMAGEWTLTIDDERTGDTGHFDSFTIQLTRFKW